MPESTPATTSADAKDSLLPYSCAECRLRRLQELVRHAATNGGPGGWPNINDWEAIKKEAGA